MATALEDGARKRAMRAAKRYRGACACGQHVWAICTRGYVVTVSPQDASLLSRQAWYVNIAYRRDGTIASVYARAKSPHVKLHHLIMPGKTIDHSDRNGMNNCRDNLREATLSQQMANRVIPRSVNIFRGVQRIGNRYRAIICDQHLGLFATAEEAARAWDKAALQRYGEFALLNFPER